MKKKLLSLFISLTMVMSLFSGVGSVFTTTALAADDDTEAEETTETSEPVDATEVILDQIFVSLEAGESITLKGTVLPVNADDTSITWSSSDGSVATVEDGTVTAIGNGYAVITATNEASGLYAECEIKVTFNDAGRDDVSTGAYKSISWAAEEGLVRGFNGGEYFGTEQSLTREQFAIILWRMAGKPAASGTMPFSDVTSDMSSYKAILWAYNEGLVKGFSDGTYGAKEELTRAQMAIVLWRLQGKEKAVSAGFSDVTSTTSGYSAINWASAKGIVKGYSDGTYKPGDAITRAEFTVMLYRYDGKYGEDTEEIAADNAVEKVSTIGYVDADGAKVSAVVVEYSEALFEAEISTDTYDVWNYMQEQESSCELGSDPAAVTAVYVNDKAETDEDPAGFGRYVIIELNTDFQLSQSVKYYLAMAADVVQTEDITAGRTTILSSETEFANYTADTYEETGRDGTVSTVTDKVADSGAYFIEDIGRYDIGIIHTTDAFEEATGEYVDLDLDYAIYVPEDYDASQEYMMVLHIEDAGNLGSDARLVLTEAQTPINLVSDEMQQYAKDQGYGGIIVVCPQITEDYRSTRDNYTFSAAVYATWDLVDMVIEEYNIDTDRIYGSGQSMGGMQVLEMAVQRDNFFAGILATGCQWGQNYNQEVEYSGDVYYEAPADGEYIWTVDSDGNACDYRNFYYLISDDNVLCSNCVGDSFSSSVWTELALLYEDLAGVEIPKATWNPLTTSVEDQNAMLDELLLTENELGIYWNAFEGGSHMGTWVYADRLDSMYYWLLSQTRESEMERDKLDLDGDFELADEQITTEDRLVYEDTEDPENNVYFVTGKAGAGTAGYNSGQYSPRGGAPTQNPGWTVEEDDWILDTVVVSMGDDGSITDEQYNSLFEEGDATEGIKALIAEGKVSINGFAIPATAEELADDGYTVNESAWLTLEEDGTWKVDRTSYDDYSDAAVATLGRISAGNEILIYDYDGDGYADEIAGSYVEAFIVDEITVNEDGSYSYARAAYTATDTDGTVYDGDHFTGDSGETVAADMVDDSIEAGDMALFYLSPEGWVVFRAIEVTGILIDGEDHGSYNIDGTEYADAMRFSRDNIIISNRCGEFVNAQKYFGFNANEEGLTVTLWFAPTTDPEKQGAPAGFTTNGNSSIFLEKAIAVAKEKLDSVEVSEDGVGVTKDYYVSQEAYDELAAAIAAAEDVLANEDSDALLDFQVYKLYLTLHGSGDDIGAWYAGFNQTGFDNAMTAVVSVQTDGATTIEDVLADYFDNVETGLSELIAAGAITINGSVLDGEISINGAPALWQEEDGTWSWKTHVMYSGSSGADGNYENAAYDFMVALSKLRGPSYTLTITGDTVTAIDFVIYDAAMAETVTVGETYTTVTKCGEEGDGSMLRTDPSTIEFPNESVEADSEGNMPEDQCVILYWYDADGWHMKRADSQVITYTSDYTYTDTLINLEYSQAWNRPTQPIKALEWLGLADKGYEMIQWFYDGYTVGFSHADSQTVLADAIAIAEAALADESIVVSDEDRAIFEAAVNSAKEVAAQTDLYSTDYEAAILALAQAYGGDGSHYATSGNVYSDGIGFINRTTQE